MYFLQDVNVLIVLFQTMLQHINNVVTFLTSSSINMDLR